MKLKRKEREEREKQEALDREKNRIKSGKEMIEAKRKYVPCYCFSTLLQKYCGIHILMIIFSRKPCRMEEQEIKKLAELRRKEKEDDRKARERVRAQIEADKAARKAKAEAAQGGTPTPTVVAPPVAVPVKPASAPKDYTEARLQVWLSTHP